MTEGYTLAVIADDNGITIGYSLALVIGPTTFSNELYIKICMIGDPLRQHNLVRPQDLDTLERYEAHRIQRNISLNDLVEVIDPYNLTDNLSSIIENHGVGLVTNIWYGDTRDQDEFDVLFIYPNIPTPEKITFLESELRKAEDDGTKRRRFYERTGREDQGSSSE